MCVVLCEGYVLDLNFVVSDRYNVLVIVFFREEGIFNDRFLLFCYYLYMFYCEVVFSVSLILVYNFVIFGKLL